MEIKKICEKIKNRIINRDEIYRNYKSFSSDNYTTFYYQIKSGTFLIEYNLYFKPSTEFFGYDSILKGRLEESLLTNVNGKHKDLYLKVKTIKDDKEIVFLEENELIRNNLNEYNKLKKFLIKTTLDVEKNLAKSEKLKDEKRLKEEQNKKEQLLNLL